MSVGRPSVGKYVGGSSETARGSGDGGRSLGLVCAVGVGRVEEVHELYATMLNSLGTKSMGKQLRALAVPCRLHPSQYVHLAWSLQAATSGSLDLNMRFQGS